MITFIKEIIPFSMYFFLFPLFHFNLFLFSFFIDGINKTGESSTGIEIVKSSLPFNSLALKTTSSVGFATWAILEQL